MTRLDEPHSGTFQRLVDYLTTNPGTAIALVGLVSALASCYPVIFFCKSFVSPAGVTALYDGAPWIPGFRFTGALENFRGTDLGAMLWSIAPNTVVEHDSIFRFSEFPFWNRYVGGGIPLFGQGQAMIGDVLHWIPVVLDGGAIGWDIKFVLSKAIFAIGMGLLVVRLTGSGLAGLLISISSCFLGFFAYRFNHPAYFVLTYAPWIVLQWDRFGRTLSRPNSSMGACMAQGLLLAVVTWLQLNAGAPKEGVVTACFLHALGVLVFWPHMSRTLPRLPSFLLVCGTGLALVMIAAPYWLVFLDALGKSFTAYDKPAAETLPPWIVIGFFDNLFFQIYSKGVLAPSVNLFILLGMASAALGLRLRQQAAVYGSWALFLLALSVAYGLIPNPVLVAIPFVNRIHHMGDTFSVPMLILSLIIAGFGIRDCVEASEPFKKTVLIVSLFAFLGLFLVFVWNAPAMTGIAIGHILLCLVSLLGFLNVCRLTGAEVRRQRAALVLAAGCFLVLHLRHGLHLATGIDAIDAYVTNPTDRANYANKSSAIEYVKNAINQSNTPTRVIGERAALFPGFNSRLGLEGIVPVDALRNPHYQRLLTLIDYPYFGWSWLYLIRSDQIENRAAALDMLGIGYIAAKAGTPMPRDVQLVHASDLDIWQRASAWPRAYFTNGIVAVRKPSDFTDAFADTSRQPFAAVESTIIPQGMLDKNVPYRTMPASAYVLTNNTTRFTVEASGPGIIVLAETYYPGDFKVTLNRQQVEYVRVNEASRGVWVDKEGKYDVSFVYKPERLGQALVTSFLGLVLLSLTILVSSGVRRKFQGAR